MRAKGRSTETSFMVLLDVGQKSEAPGGGSQGPERLGAQESDFCDAVLSFELLHESKSKAEVEDARKWCVVEVDGEHGCSAVGQQNEAPGGEEVWGVVCEWRVASA